MFKRIKRYLVFLCAFALTTANITDFNLFLEDTSLETASIEQDTDNSLESDAKGKKYDSEEEVIELNESSEQIGTSEQETTDEFDLIETECRNDTSLRTVVYYIHKYQKLPPIYVTKKEAYELGGTLGEVLNHNSIGGDYFGNYQGILPQKEGRSYKECDIDTLGSDNRGKKRLVYSNDGLMYYTEDHYATFTLLDSNWNGTNLQNL